MGCTADIDKSFLSKMSSKLVTLSFQNPNQVMKNTDSEGSQISKTIKSYCKALDSSITLMETLLKSRIELKNLTEVQSVLLQNRLDEFAQQNESNNNSFNDSCIPSEVKCPVCFEIYSNKIYQCINGHCICSSCRYNILCCPECRASYVVGNFNQLVRNRALESLMATSLKIDCPNSSYGCVERLKCKEVQSHFKHCRFKKKSEELIKVENDIELMKEGIEKLEDKLKCLNKKCTETGDVWTKVAEQDENRLQIIQAKSQYQVRKKEMDKCQLNIKLKSLIYFNQ